MVEVVLGNERPQFALPDRLPGPWEQEAAPEPQEQRTMRVPVQEVASELEQVEVLEPELKDVPEEEVVGCLLPWRPMPQRG